MNYWLLLFPLVGALVGWLLHHIAIGYVVSRILPARKPAIAQSIGRIAANEFQQFTGLEERINDPKNLESVLPVIESHIDHFLNEKLKQEMPMISMFIGNKTTEKLKEIFMKEIQALFPQVIGKFAGNLKSSIDLGAIVSNKINAISTEDLKSKIQSGLSHEISMIKWFGAICGLVIGLVQLLLLYLLLL